MACKDGQRVGRRDRDGLVTHPHTHYARQPIDPCHRHERGKVCGNVRDEISSNISQFIDLNAKSNWSNDELHDKETCLCSRGKIGKEKKEQLQTKSAALTTKPMLV